jgi:hypothetical protein
MIRGISTGYMIYDIYIYIHITWNGIKIPTPIQLDIGGNLNKMSLKFEIGGFSRVFSRQIEGFARWHFIRG